MRRFVPFCLLFVFVLGICACGFFPSGKLSYAPETSDPLAVYALTGDTQPVLDPGIIRQGSNYYAFSTDVAGFSGSGHLPIRCSQDKLNWKNCGSVFPSSMPSWISKAEPGVLGLWAPDVSYFNGEYHVYYNASKLCSQLTVIGLATNSTLDSNDPSYKWVDCGMVLRSGLGDDFNALDPSILIDSDGRVWMTYGSYWTGIKQREIDAATGKLLASNPIRYDLATRPGVPGNPIEAASLVHHGSYYYLFVSMDHCCEQTLAEDDYKEAVGRSSTPHGPFVDEAGTPMMWGGGTVLIKGDADWNAPGGGTVYLDVTSGDSFIIFHAQSMAEGGEPYAWVKNLDWVNDWPAIGK
jgi:arabinan endo-1,5-alpha-L-arabinosidase